MLSDRCLSVLSCLSCLCRWCIVAKFGWMDQDDTWHEGRPLPMPHCVRWGLNCPPPKKKGGGTAPNFRPVSVVAKRQTLTVFQHPSTAESTL